MPKITVREEHKVESEDGRLYIKLCRQNGKFDHLYISSGTTGAVIRQKPKEIIKMLQSLEEEVLS